MSEKESSAGMLKVALVASLVTGSVFVGGGYIAVTAYRSTEGVAVPSMSDVAVDEVSPSLAVNTASQGVPELDAGHRDADPTPDIGPEGRALMEALRLENGLSPEVGDADMNAAGSMGYIPRITPEIANSEDALAEFAERVPGLSAIMQTPTFNDSTQDILEMPEANKAFSGEAVVYAPGIIMVDFQEMAISGIISPITSDECTNSNGASFSCGSWSLGAWTAAVHGKTVHCLLLGDAEGDVPDARCEMETADLLVDVGSWAVTAGVALADQDDDVRYLKEEGVATQGMIGLWSTAFNFGGVRNEIEMISPPEDIDPAAGGDGSGPAVDISSDPGTPPDPEVSSTEDTSVDIPDRDPVSVPAIAPLEGGGE